jgi:hypothetical protein
LVFLRLLENRRGKSQTIVSYLKEEEGINLSSFLIFSDTRSPNSPRKEENEESVLSSMNCLIGVD